MSSTTRILWGGGAATLVAGLFFFIDPNRARFLPTCPLHTLTGLYCPGCGATRAVHALLHGHVLAALRLNALLLLALPVGAGVGLWRWWSGGGLRWRPAWTWWLLAVAVVFGVLRNIPSYPFTLLAP
jgi:hypothetical protein